MNDPTEDFAATIERFSGFADVYDRYRPAPPAALAALLSRYAHVARPQLVVDLGSGTGLSTRYWADKAERVIGIDPTADMRHQAEAQSTAPNIAYHQGFSHTTGLPDHCADIVTCAQALHWMEPQATFLEAARILRPGGVFAACDYDWPPATGQWEADAAYGTCAECIQACGQRSERATPIRRWHKQEHLAHMQASGCFRYTCEILLHHVEPGNAERLVGLVLSQGSVMTLLKSGWREDELGIDALREVAERVLGYTLLHRPALLHAGHRLYRRQAMRSNHETQKGGRHE